MKKRQFWQNTITLICIGVLGLTGLSGCGKEKQKNKTEQTSTETSQKADPVSKKKHKPTKIKPQLSPEETEQLNQALANHHFSGTILLVKDKKPIYAKGYGYAIKSSKKKNKVDSIYQLASVQKIITSTLVLKDIQQHKLSFDDKLSEFYPDFPHGDDITIKSMLNMTSGLHLPNKDRTNEYYKSQDQYIDYYAKTATYKVSDHWNYEAINYSILAGILEKVNHKTYKQLVTDEIIKPLKLKNIGFVSPKNELGNRSVGYLSPEDKKPYKEKPYQVAREVGTGDMYSDALTLYKLISKIIDGKVISKSLFESTHQLPNGEAKKYLSGCYVQPRTYMMHGMGFGYDSTVVISKDGRNAVILLSNVSPKGYAPDFANQIYEGLLNWTPQSQETPSTTNAQAAATNAQ